MSFKFIKAGLNAMFCLDPSDFSKRLIFSPQQLNFAAILLIVQNDTSQISDKLLNFFFLSMMSVDFVTLSIFFLLSVMYFWLFKPYRGMSCICCTTNLLFLRKTTLAVLEVEYVDMGHYSVALASTFPGHCIKRKKICRQSYFCEKLRYFSLHGEENKASSRKLSSAAQKEVVCD